MKNGNDKDSRKYLVISVTFRDIRATEKGDNWRWEKKYKIDEAALGNEIMKGNVREFYTLHDTPDAAYAEIATLALACYTKHLVAFVDVDINSYLEEQPILQPTFLGYVKPLDESSDSDESEEMTDVLLSRPIVLEKRRYSIKYLTKSLCFEEKKQQPVIERKYLAIGVNFGEIYKKEGKAIYICERKQPITHEAIEQALMKNDFRGFYRLHNTPDEAYSEIGNCATPPDVKYIVALVDIDMSTARDLISRTYEDQWLLQPVLKGYIKSAPGFGMFDEKQTDILLKEPIVLDLRRFALKKEEACLALNPV